MLGNAFAAGLTIFLPVVAAAPSEETLDVLSLLVGVPKRPKLLLTVVLPGKLHIFRPGLFHAFESEFLRVLVRIGGQIF